MKRASSFALLAFALAPSIAAADPPLALSLPGATGAVGFDDMRTNPESGSVFVPGGVTGKVYEIAPRTHAITVWSGFPTAPGVHGHDTGPTSLDFAPGLLLVSDRSSRTIEIADRANHTIVGHIPLGGPPDYVRYVAETREVWVTEPHLQRIEVFDFAPWLTHREQPTLRGTIAVPGGPEALEIDPARGVAYTNVWTGAHTLAIDLRAHTIRATWASGCSHDDTQGLALDAARAMLVVACEDGTVVAHDVTTGHATSHLATARGVDIIAFDSANHLVAVPASGAGRLTVVALDPHGALSVHATASIPTGAHCAAVAAGGEVVVCDPAQGRLLIVH